MTEIVEAGFYRARATEYFFGFAETGTEQVAVTFTLATEGRWNGHRIAWFGYFTEGAARWTIESLRACGWDGDDVTELVGLDRDEVELEVVHETYQGEVRPKVRWVNRVRGAKMKRGMTPEQKRALAARMQQLVVASKTELPPRGDGRGRVRASGEPSPNGGVSPGGFPGL